MTPEEVRDDAITLCAACASSDGVMSFSEVAINLGVSVEALNMAELANKQGRANTWPYYVLRGNWRLPWAEAEAMLRGGWTP